MKRNLTYFFIALSACLFCGFKANAESFVINNENFSTYFGEDGYLKESVPAGSTLDFQGTFQGDKYSLFINKKVDVISSTGLTFLILGGIFYTFGIPFYVWKSRKYTHAIWHFMVLCGTIMHFFAVLYGCVLN